MPYLDVGEMAFEGKEVGLIQAAAANTNLLSVRLDNPLMVWRGIPQVQVGATDSYIEEHKVTLDPFSIVNRYADIQSVAMNGDGPYVDGSTVAAVDNFSLLSYARQDLAASTATSANYFTRGLQVGYRSLQVFGSVRDRNFNVEQRTNAHLNVALDPLVYLVPVEVWVMRSSNHPANNQRRLQQAVLWDQQQETYVSNVLDTSGGGRAKASHTLAHLPDGGSFDTWVDPARDSASNVPVYEGPGGIYTPDSALAACGVQFRMVQYREITVPERVAFPLRQPDDDLDQDDAHYEKSALERRPCEERNQLIHAHADHRSNRLVVAFTYREGFPLGANVNGAELSRYVKGGQSQSPLVCTSLSSEVPAVTLAHEIGHAAGMGDCESGDRCVLMSGGGGRLPPSAAECGALRRWARNRAIDEVWNLTEVALAPAPGEDEEWKWPE